MKKEWKTFILTLLKFSGKSQFLKPKGQIMTSRICLTQRKPLGSMSHLLACG